MALTNAQMNDANYLANLISTLNAQRTEELRQNDMSLRQNQRRLQQANALNGINGGYEESNYARLLANANSAASNINRQYMPQINEYQGYLDALRAAQAARAAYSGGGGGGTKKPATTTAYRNDPSITGVLSAPSVRTELIMAMDDAAKALGSPVSGRDAYDGSVRDAYAKRTADLKKPTKNTTPPSKR